MNPQTQKEVRAGEPAAAQAVPAQAALDVGAALRAGRLKKGHTLEAIGQRTRIPRKFLLALEENRFEDFPAPVYLRGFLKSYCENLDLDFEPLWKTLSPDRPAAAAAAPQEPPAESEGEGLRTDAVAIGAILAALAVAAVLAVWLRRPAPPAAPSEASSAPPAAIAPLRAPSEPQLAVEFRQEVWLSLSLDGAPRFEGRVPQGTRQEWQARKLITLRSSNPQALKLTLNGAPYALPAPDAAGLYRIEAP